MQLADEELIRLLAALCSDEKATRTASEEALHAGQLQCGFPTRLASFAAAGPAAPDALPLRQMALTILRRLSLSHWAELAAEDRAAVRAALLRGLGAAADDQSMGQLRGLLHACVANARANGGHWPELHEWLGAGVMRGTAREAACCVECAAVLLRECGPDVAVALGPLQEPMRCLAMAEATPPELRRQCVNAHAAGVVAVLVGDSQAAPSAARDAVVDGLPTWLAAHAALCAGAEGWDDRDRVSCAFSAVCTVTTLSRHKELQEPLADGLEAVLRPACVLLQRLAPAYEQAIVHANDGGASEEEGGVCQLVAQLMELVQAMLAMPKLRPLLKGRVRSILQLFVPFMQITEAQAESWRADPNAFLAQEEDEYAQGCMVRLSADGLLGELLERTKRETARAVADIAGELLERGGQGCAAGEAHAWKRLEVALFVFGSAAAEASVRSLRQGELAPLVPVALGAAGRLCADAATPEFLRARAFAVLRKMGDAVCALVAADVPALLQAAASALAATEPLVVRVSACRAFCRFLTAVDDQALREKVLVEHGVLPSLASLLQGADEELLHLTLESLCVIIQRCPGATVSVAESLCVVILDIWRRSATDPMVHLQILDLVSCATGTDPRLQLAMEERLLPVVAADLLPAADPHATAAAIELYGVLLKRAAVPFSAQIWECVEPLISAVTRSDESGLLQNACDTLCVLIQRSPSQLGGVERLLPPLLRCVERLLGPDLDDSACFFVGQFTMLLLSHFGALIPADLMVGLLRALVLRLARARHSYVLQELIVVFAKLLHQDLGGVLAALSGMQVPAGDGGAARSGLELLLSTWVASAAEIRAKRARNVTVSALCRLHEQCAQDEQLRALRIGQPGDLPLPDQLLATIVAGLEFENERCRRERERALDASDSDVDDDDDSGDGDGAAARLLSEIVDLEDDDELDDAGRGGDTFQDLERADPLFSLDLRKLAADYLAAHAACAAGRQELAERLAAAVADARQNP